MSADLIGSSKLPGARRCVLLIIDSFGLGALPDASLYGDEGANTALHAALAAGGARWPFLRTLGLGNAAGLLGVSLPGCEPVAAPRADYGLMAPRSPGKDTTTGHWELAGLVLHRPFHVFAQSGPAFPPELVAAFEAETGRRMLGNEAASGTEIINRLGDRHVETGEPICYSSADSVFQIAAHEQVIGLEELYGICRTARRLCDPYMVARVIARPFVGSSGAYVRTAGRRDFSIALPGPTVMDALAAAGVATTGVGKIGDIFNEQGLTESHHDTGNAACLARLEELLRRARRGPEFIFVNLVDTDMMYGHRRDAAGYHDAVQAVDTALAAAAGLLDHGDLLLVCADHGCDPSHSGSDHTREYVPLLVHRPGAGSGRSLGIRSSLGDAAAAVAHFFGLPPLAGFETCLDPDDER